MMVFRHSFNLLESIRIMFKYSALLLNDSFLKLCLIDRHENVKLCEIICKLYSFDSLILYAASCGVVL